MKKGGLLAGRCVLVTRRAEDAAAWIRRLEEEGARALALPCLETRPVADPVLGRRLAAALAARPRPWLALTSPRGVDALVRLLGAAGAGVPPGVPVAAIGEATAARAARILGRSPALVAPAGTAVSLAASLAERLGEGSGARVVVAASDRGSRDLEEILAPRGVEVLRFAVYRTIPARPRRPRVDLAALGVDTVLLASPSAVEGLVAQAEVSPGIRLVAIGPVTARAIRDAGLPCAAEATRRDIDGLIEAILRREDDGGGDDG